MKLWVCSGYPISPNKWLLSDVPALCSGTPQSQALGRLAVAAIIV